MYIYSSATYADINISAVNAVNVWKLNSKNQAKTRSAISREEEKSESVPFSSVLKQLSQNLACLRSSAAFNDFIAKCRLYS